MRQLMHSFRGKTAPVEILSSVERGDITAFCLFAYNVESPQQLKALTSSLHEAAKRGGQQPPIIGIDQEGGQLIAVTGGATELPGNMALGATRSPELAYKAGRVLGRELLAMGVNMNFAPSLDVNNNPGNPVIGIRSFGDDPVLVGQLGTALAQGMQAEGVIATGKHFPGHGDTIGDSHHVVPRVDHPLERITDIELKPFSAAIEGGIQAVMSSHIIYPALDADRPGTISYDVIYKLLRQQMGFTGLTVSDAMDMYAVAHLGHEYAIREAIVAGNDLVLLGHLPGQLAMIGDLRHLEMVASVDRITAARSQLTTDFPDFSVIGCEEHQAIAQEIADRSITVVRDNGQLPLQPAVDETIAIITMKPENLTPADTSDAVTIELAATIRQRHPRTIHVEIPIKANDDDVRQAMAQVRDADIVIVGTISAEQYQGQADLIQALHHAEKSPVVIALRTPYDLVAFPMIETYLCAYGIRAVSMEAVTRVLFGEIEGRGQLPCQLPAHA